MKPYKVVLLHWLSAIALVATLLMAGEVWAAPGAPASGDIACKVGNPVYSANYSPFTTGNTAQALTVEVTCSRSTDLIATTVSYQLGSTNGNNDSSGNRAALAGTSVKYIKYDLYLDNNCSTQWLSTTGNRIVNTALSLPAGATSATAQHTFYACIPGSQTNVVFGDGYSDTVKLIITNVSGSPGAPNTSNQTDGLLQVTINVPKVCNISTKPGPVAFGTYVAFGPAKTASSNFGVTCTSATTYDMSITDSNDRPISADGFSGVLAGLGYKLSLSETSGTGSGTEKQHRINGTMPAKQPGSCANGGCSGEKSNLHKLVVTY